MKTIRLARTIRRQLPSGLLIWIGPEGIRIRQKRSVPCYSLSWKEVWERAQFLGVTHGMVLAAAQAAEQTVFPWDAAKYYQAGDRVLLDGQEAVIGTPGVNNPPSKEEHGPETDTGGA